jgi:hypothetical protein
VAGKTAGHPSSQPTQTTSEAATAPETAAITQGEIAGEGSGEVGSGCALSGCTSSPAFRVSPDTSDASRSMVGGARLARPESGDGLVSSGLSSAIAWFLIGWAEHYQIRRLLLELGSDFIRTENAL